MAQDTAPAAGCTDRYALPTNPVESTARRTRAMRTGNGVTSYVLSDAIGVGANRKAYGKGFLKKRRPGVMPRIGRREDGGVQVIGRSKAEQALDPAPGREGAMPRKGKARPVRSQVWSAGLPADQMPDDKGRITEEPCAINVARTVLKQRWMERSVHRL